MASSEEGEGDEEEEDSSGQPKSLARMLFFAISEHTMLSHQAEQLNACFCERKSVLFHLLEGPD